MQWPSSPAASSLIHYALAEAPITWSGVIAALVAAVIATIPRLMRWVEKRGEAENAERTAAASIALEQSSANAKTIESLLADLNGLHGQVTTMHAQIGNQRDQIDELLAEVTMEKQAQQRLSGWAQKLQIQNEIVRKLAVDMMTQLKLDAAEQSLRMPPKLDPSPDLPT